MLFLMSLLTFAIIIVISCQRTTVCVDIFLRMHLLDHSKTRLIKSMMKYTVNSISIVIISNIFEKKQASLIYKFCCNVVT